VRREVPPRGLDEQRIAASQIETVEFRQARAFLDAVLDTLDEDKRTVFVLYELEELQMMEVAAIVGCPLQTAYSRLHAARRQVEQAVQKLHAKEKVR
jgi:RNA polymerase sigma-70 factor (ECF subfamily)